MRKITYLLCLLLLGTVVSYTSCAEGDVIDEAPQNHYTTTRRIAVFAPESTMTRLKRIADWAEENINVAQRGLDTQVRIELEWYEESDKKEFYNDYGAALSDENVCAIIGPMRSDLAYEACQMAGKLQDQQSKLIKPIVLPTATSTEVQRLGSDCKYLWCLSENDVTQSMMLITLATQMATSNEQKKVCLIHSDDLYGGSFADWVPFICSELGTTFYKSATIATDDAQAEQHIKEAMNMMGEDAQIIIASSNMKHYVICDSLLHSGALDTKRPESIQLIASDQGLNTEGVSRYHRMWGVAPAPKPSSGFLQAYRSRMEQEWMDGDSEMYDAVLFLFYGLYLEAMEAQDNSQGERMYNMLCRVVDGKGTPKCSWTTAGIGTALRAYQNNQSPSVNGCTNDWVFSNKVRTSVTNSYYLLWNCISQSLKYITYLTSDTSGKNTNINDAWSWYGLPLDSIEASSVTDKDYAPLHQKWAFLVASSRATDPSAPGILANYRHQANVLGMYQMLKRHGYDDDHIVLIMEDDIAYNELNSFKGDVHYRVGGENVRDGAVVDYKPSEFGANVNAANAIADILSGDPHGKYKSVLRPDYDDDILIYWCGHATENGELCWLDDKFSRSVPFFWTNNLKSSYRKVLLLFETCYSGQIGNTLSEIPGVLCITAASENEKSYADNIERDPQLNNTYLSNGFSDALIQILDENPSISLFDLYIKLAANTCGSHVRAYGVQGYGSLYNSSMLDYLDR